MSGHRRLHDIDRALAEIGFRFLVVVFAENSRLIPGQILLRECDRPATVIGVNESTANFR